MNMTTQGHNHSGKNHLLGMLGIGAAVLIVLLFAGRAFREALPLAAVLACPLMMIGMMFMMRGGGHQHGSDAADHHDHVPADRPSSTSSTSPQLPTITHLN